VERARSLGTRFREGFRVIEALEENGRVVGVRGLDGGEIRARWTLFADGAHTLFTQDGRERRHIDALMGWWEGPGFEPGRLDMVFDRELAPLYGWLFPETPTRVNIGICIDAQDEYGRRLRTSVRCSAAFSSGTARAARGRARSAGGGVTPSFTPRGSPTSPGPVPCSSERPRG
jgi:flavin-dependent dehydrogenase